MMNEDNKTDNRERGACAVLRCTTQAEQRCRALNLSQSIEHVGQTAH